MLKVLLTALITISLTGCVGAPEVKPLPDIWGTLKPTNHIPVAATEVPPKPMSYLVVDSNGVEHAAFKASDLQSLKLAFISANANADKVAKLNLINELVTYKLNLMEELKALEEYKSAKLENELILQESKADKDLIGAKIEKVSWQIVSVLALIVGL